MLVINIGKRFKNKDYVFGLRWMMNVRPEEMSTEVGLFAKQNPQLNEVKSRALAQGVKFIATCKSEGVLFTGWPETRVRLKGNEISVGKLLASTFSTGVVVARIPSAEMLYACIFINGHPVPNGELVHSVIGKIDPLMSAIDRKLSELEDIHGLHLPVMTPSEDMNFFATKEGRVFVDFDLLKELPGIKGASKATVESTSFGFKKKDALLLGVMVAALGLAANRDQILGVGEVDSPISTIPNISQNNQVSVEEKYISDLRVAMAEHDFEAPMSLQSMYGEIRRVPIKKGGWELTKVVCQRGSCDVLWRRKTGGISYEVEPAKILSLSDARGVLNYSATMSNLGLPASYKKVSDLIIPPEFGESMIIDVVYPLFMKLHDLKYAVSIGTPTSLVPMSPPRVPNIKVRNISLSGTMAGDGVPLLLDVVSKLPINIGIKKVIFEFGKSPKDDRVSIDAELLTVSGGVR